MTASFTNALMTAAAWTATAGIWLGLGLVVLVALCLLGAWAKFRHGGSVSE